jgi:4-amino-4-deoxy-L-arabinose transferase-like glycosyltransferase
MTLALLSALALVLFAHAAAGDDYGPVTKGVLWTLCFAVLGGAFVMMGGAS